MGVSENCGFPQQLLVFLLKIIILRWRLGVPPFKETPIYIIQKSGTCVSSIFGVWSSLIPPKKAFSLEPISFKTGSLHKNEWINYVLNLTGFWQPPNKNCFFLPSCRSFFTIKNPPSSTKLTSGGVFVAASIRKPPRKSNKTKTKAKTPGWSLPFENPKKTLDFHWILVV